MVWNRLNSGHVKSIAVYCCAIFVLGCASTSKDIVVQDKKVDRYVTNAHEAFHEGRIDEAESYYRKALIRSWATDDPYESGTAAYNLAACLVSQDELTKASDWLVDSRVELCRAGASTGNTWLLSAEIAMSQSRLADAQLFVAYASKTCPPCEIVDTCCLCGPSESCCGESQRDCCAAPIPCIGKNIEANRAKVECQNGYRARIELARARIATQEFRIADAERHLACACNLTAESCDFSLHADRHDVAAAIHDAKEEYLQAGAHRDREARLLRCIGHYRAIPNVLVAASESYSFAGRMDLAVDRVIRAARIWYARSEYKRAWELVEQASGMAMSCGCEAVEIRLALTAKQIRDALEASKLEPMEKEPAMLDGPLSEPPDTSPAELYSPENLESLLSSPLESGKTASRAAIREKTAEKTPVGDEKWVVQSTDLALPSMGSAAMLAPHKLASVDIPPM
ncbi:hypothetical protein LOC67_02920 [Stieleria sp. JC731]|uniref:hypothetical protein n=1 Tax=Pirellulaceae TaxID=2691357 RepID=UPI001E4E3F4A|nr:hypothetical protein [Stieleria sp. JC731]MCC9599499.1 hypothetical protein [Stieleria sp. JC731]